MKKMKYYYPHSSYSKIMRDFIVLLALAVIMAFIFKIVSSIFFRNYNFIVKR